jgi:hypothetical protein
MLAQFVLGGLAQLADIQAGVGMRDQHTQMLYDRLLHVKIRVEQKLDNRGLNLLPLHRGQYGFCHCTLSFFLSNKKSQYSQPLGEHTGYAGDYFVDEDAGVAGGLPDLLVLPSEVAVLLAPLSLLLLSPLALFSPLVGLAASPSLWSPWL